MFSACNTVLVDDSSFSSVCSLLFYPRNATLTQKTCHIFDMFFSYLHCPQSMWSSVYVTVGRPSVRSSVPSGRRSPWLRVCCCGPGGQEILIHYCTAGAQQQPQRSGVRQRDVRNATLSADVGSSTLTRLTEQMQTYHCENFSRNKLSLQGGKMLRPRR